jgi:putative membrane protein
MMYDIARFGYGAYHVLPWFGWIGPIIMVVLLALIITALVLLIRYLARGSRAGRSESSAMEILKTRYARGEISKEEYEEKRRDLGE